MRLVTVYAPGADPRPAGPRPPRWYRWSWAGAYPGHAADGQGNVHGCAVPGAGRLGRGLPQAALAGGLSWLLAPELTMNTSPLSDTSGRAGQDFLTSGDVRVGTRIRPGGAGGRKESCRP